MSKHETSNRRDPIRDAPLRDPGESLREQLRDRFEDEAISWLVVAFLAIVMAVAEWIRWLTNAKYMPVTMTTIAVAISAFAVWRIRRTLIEALPWKLGLKGERAVGQFLQAQLAPRNYTVIHDICIDDFNVDHAAIGPGGVFAIEVKTHSKPRRGDARVTYDGEQVRIDGIAPDRNPVVQVRAGAESLRKLLAQYTGRDVQVRPVVLYPGWYVDPQPPGIGTWVLNEKAFVKFLEREPPVLTSEDCRVFAEGLSRYVRDQLKR